MLNVNRTMDEFIKNYGDKQTIRKGILSLLNNPDFLKIHPEAKEHKNSILRKIDENIQKQNERTNSLKMFAFLERVANEIITDKAEKLVKLQNFLERSDVPADLKNKIAEAKDRMSENIVNAFGLLRQAAETTNDKEFKTAIISVLTLASDDLRNKDVTVFIFKDINEESDVDFDKVEKFFEKNKELVKLDKYIEEFEKLVSLSEKEQTKKRKISDISL